MYEWKVITLQEGIESYIEENRMIHYRIVCTKCHITIEECRCVIWDKPIKYSTCDRCLEKKRNKQNEISRILQDEN